MPRFGTKGEPPSRRPSDRPVGPSPRTDPLTAPVLDLRHLAQQAGGDRELAREVLGLFAEQCARLRPEIAGAAGARLGEAVHTLKGAARAVGAWRLADLAEAVERGADETGRADDRRRLVRAVEEAERAARRALEQDRLANG